MVSVFSSSKHSSRHEAGLFEVFHLQVVIFAQPRVRGDFSLSRDTFLWTEFGLKKTVENLEITWNLCNLHGMICVSSEVDVFFHESAIEILLMVELKRNHRKLIFQTLFF